jgi:hypothetical protein
LSLRRLRIGIRDPRHRCRRRARLTAIVGEDGVEDYDTYSRRLTSSRAANRDIDWNDTSHPAVRQAERDERLDYELAGCDTEESQREYD